MPVWKKVVGMAFVWCDVASNCADPRSAVADDQKRWWIGWNSLGGQVTRDPAGDIIAIDLENRPTTDDDLKLFAADPNLQKLVVWVTGSPIRESTICSARETCELELQIRKSPTRD